MSTRFSPDLVLEREWQAQERALRAERQGAIDTDDVRVEQYRAVARALHRSPIDPIPKDFARRTAERIESLATWMDERFERWLQRGLIAALAIASTATLLYFGASWWKAFTVRPPLSIDFNIDTTATWSLVVVACLGASWAIEHWRQRGAR